MLEARLKADRLRSTLGVFERSEFFFTLPGALNDSISAVSASIAKSYTVVRLFLD